MNKIVSTCVSTFIKKIFAYLYSGVGAGAAGAGAASKFLPGAA
jgi:hypothetical protein